MYQGVVKWYFTTLCHVPSNSLAYFSQKCALFLEYRLVDMRLRHVRLFRIMRFFLV